MPNENEIWIRIVSNLVAGSAALMMSFTLVSLMSGWKSIGHRLLLVFASVFCLCRAIANLGTAWDLYHGRTLLALWMHGLLAIVSLLFAIHLVVSRDDLSNTLCTSEMEDRLRRDRADDQIQARLLLNYVTIQTQLRTQRVIEEQEAWANRAG